MTWLLVILLVGLMAMVVVSLVRGIVAFLQTTKVDLDQGDNDGVATDMQMLQNKMMFNRIKYQALAIVVVGVLLAISR